MECPKCKRKNVVASGPAMQTVRHVVTAGAVAHVIEDHWTCKDCGAAFNVAVAPKVEPVKPSEPAKPAAPKVEPGKPAEPAKAV